ncbi:hypothetical protein AGMMS50262_15780 [Bacteroidia bacterium]|nr:hypothetical protein AGMMS50262_15780 [Bacteroidia bacterium]
MNLPELADFSLAGGTALALRYCQVHSTNKVGIFCYINDIKVDLVKYHYFPVIASVEDTDGIRLLNDKDLIAMKVNAILRRGVKKDFWDIAELMQHYTITDFVNYYTQKYPNQRQLISIPRALIYFEDAEKSENPICLNEQTWEDVKTVIRKKVNEFL